VVATVDVHVAAPAATERQAGMGSSNGNQAGASGNAGDGAELVVVPTTSAAEAESGAGQSASLW
jgi:hypothetical protein